MTEMADQPRMAQDGFNRRTKLNEGYVRKGGQNPPPQNFTRPAPPPAFKPGSGSDSPPPPSNPPKPKS
jgi:hypothetical protein